jgi:hypothetical protein
MWFNIYNPFFWLLTTMSRELPEDTQPDEDADIQNQYFEEEE